ncbi:MerR family transcriptional regulator [Streptomyces sp. WAC07149]|uniref:MerR family transcriptional regulator n=1 Tax=Streptomyces sp. WAC07149 TaxID=2487425 RepID=UPI000F7AB39F|nr:MerR family transcriptional regulator [Streptomyces sp. WAC07149]RST08959.1 MerR family transcriptional regulator [Streptomyces sp. WAC07149]
MHSDTLHSIGELARRTGLTVKTIRFYSDKGIVPPAGRSPAGYRLYGPDALARLALVRTLRELGLDLATVRRVLDREASLPEVADAHADALDVQIRSLRVRQAVLRAVAQRGATPMEMDLMHRLATLSRAEQQHLLAEFIEAVFADGEPNPEFASLMRTAMPEIPDNPAPEQVGAWVELAELCRSAEFRSAVRRVAEDQARAPSPEAVADLHDDLNRTMRERVEEATGTGLLPASLSAVPPADLLGSLYGHAFRDAGDGDLRRWLLARLHLTADPHVERYWQLLATVNGWPASPTLAPVHSWFTTALREASVTRPVPGGERVRCGS